MTRTILITVSLIIVGFAAGYLWRATESKSVAANAPTPGRLRNPDVQQLKVDYLGKSVQDLYEAIGLPDYGFVNSLNHKKVGYINRLSHDGRTLHRVEITVEDDAVKEIVEFN